MLSDLLDKNFFSDKEIELTEIDPNVDEFLEKRALKIIHDKGLDYNKEEWLQCVNTGTSSGLINNPIFRLSENIYDLKIWLLNNSGKFKSEIEKLMGPDLRGNRLTQCLEDGDLNLYNCCKNLITKNDISNEWRSSRRYLEDYYGKSFSSKHDLFQWLKQEGKKCETDTQDYDQKSLVDTLWYTIKIKFGKKYERKNSIPKKEKFYVVNVEESDEEP